MQRAEPSYTFANSSCKIADNLCQESKEHPYKSRMASPNIDSVWRKRIWYLYTIEIRFSFYRSLVRWHSHFNKDNVSSLPWHVNSRRKKQQEHRNKKTPKKKLGQNAFALDNIVFTSAMKRSASVQQEQAQVILVPDFKIISEEFYATEFDAEEVQKVYDPDRKKMIGTKHM